MTITQTHPKPRPFDVSEYYAMAAAGILREDEHLELLDGVIFLKYAAGPRLFDVGEYYAMAAAGILRARRTPGASAGKDIRNVANRLQTRG